MAKDEKDLEARFAELAERNQQLMAMLEAKLEPAAPAGGIGADQLESILTRSMSAATKGTELLASKMKPENVEHRHIGPFEHPLGGIEMPKPALHRDVIFAGRYMRLDELTYAEAIALNALSTSLARSQRRIARDGRWVAKVNDNDQQMQISVPLKNLDDRNDLPSFLEICQELTSGERPPEQSELAAEMVLLKQQMAALREARAAS